MNKSVEQLLTNLENQKKVMFQFIEKLPDGNIKEKFNGLFAKIQSGNINIVEFQKEAEEIKEYAKNVKK